VLRSLLATFFLSVFALLAPAPAQPAGNANRLADTDPFAVPGIGFEGGVSAIGGIIYAVREGFRPLTLDLYLPPRRTADRPAPLVIYIHGGAWVTGHPRSGGMPRMLAALAARGYVVASISYRLRAEAPFPVAIQDVRDAIRFLRTNAQSYGIDGARVGIWGASAGGQLAALAATGCGIGALDSPASVIAREGTSPCVQAAVSWYGVHDFATIPLPVVETGPRPYLGCNLAHCSRETMAMASAVTFVDPTDPPMLLIHGGADTLVVPSQSVELDQRLRDARVPSELIIIPGVNHGFVGPDDGTTQQAQAQAFAATARFFDQRLRP
jgi:acetyl esterase/lipase